MSQIKISFLLPTRGRRELAERFISGALEKAERPSQIEFVVYTDDDDMASRSIHVDGANLRLITGARVFLGMSNAECFNQSTGEIIILGNDDVEIGTSKWDVEIIANHAKFDDQVYLAYPNDCYKGKRLASFPILSRNTLLSLDQPFPKIYSGSFIDTHLMEIFIRLKHLGEDRIVYLEDVIFEHKHFRTGKSKKDQTYLDRDRFGDDMTFLSLHDVRRASARALLGKIHNPDFLRTFTYVQPAVLERPTSIVSFAVIVGKLLLPDSDLPMRYRLKFFVYMIARWLVKTLTPRTGK